VDSGVQEFIEKAVGDELRSLRMLIQTEGLLERPLDEQRGRIVGSGVLLQGVEAFGEEVWVGEELAAVVKLMEGDLIRLRSVWKLEGIPLEVPITRVFSSGLQEVDRLVVRLDRDRLASWLGIKASVSRIEIQLQDPFRAEAIQSALETGLDMKFQTWKQTESALWYSLRLEKIVLSLVLSMTVLLGALAVHLALSVRIAEKTREIALLRGLGASDASLSRLYLSEGIVIGTLASLCGLGAGFAFCKWVSEIYRFPEIYYLTELPVQWSWPANLGLTGVAILLSALASYWPARRVQKVSVVDGLRS
jgi:lipoprotein-releasing system permease protein